MQHYPVIEFATLPELIVAIIGIVGLVFSNFLGADLIFRYKVGLHKEK